MSADQRQQTRSGGNAAGGGIGKQLPKPAFDPSSPGLVQPWKGLVDTGVITCLEVQFTPMGVQIGGRASARLAAVEGAGINTTDVFPLGLLRELAEKGNLIPLRGGKKKSGTPATQQKPAKSLVAEDMDGSLNAAALQQRINEIARSCGGGPLVGRVRSQGAFEGTETVSYRSWWDAASAEHRALSLSDAKRRSAFTAEGLSRLNGLQCPFRGTLEFEVSVGDED